MTCVNARRRDILFCDIIVIRDVTLDNVSVNGWGAGAKINNGVAKISGRASKKK